MPRQFDPNDYEWFCDECGSYLNGQSNWTGEAGRYTCMKCGCSNRIRKNNTFDEPVMPGVYPEEEQDTFDRIFGSIFGK